MKRSTIMFTAFIVFGLVVILFSLCGCEMLTQLATDPNGTAFVMIDPNQLDALMKSGHAVQATGIALGRPELIGLGILIVSIAGTVSIAKMKKP